jgi:hypothetical protein
MSNISCPENAKLIFTYKLELLHLTSYGISLQIASHHPKLTSIIKKSPYILSQFLQV